MLVAVDTNVALDLAGKVADVVDAIAVIRKRLKNARLVAPPTVVLELMYLSESAAESAVRNLAETALRSLVSKWGIKPMNLVPAGHGIVEAIAKSIQDRELLPDEESHDAMILAESALLECSVLLTSDGHLRSVDYEQLSFLLKESDVGSPIIATPREIVRKFFR